jgi:hypothetical protein
MIGGLHILYETELRNLLKLLSVEGVRRRNDGNNETNV